MSRVRTVLSRVPDIDDTRRRLSDVLQVPATCRGRPCCNRARCRGGYGPPC